MLDGLVYRVVGTPPTPGATRGDALRWIRKFYRLNLAVIAVIVIVALFVGGTFLWIVAAVTAALSVGGFAFTSLSIRREGSRGR
jgi:uncharacterized membrane protein YdbT with pleckstrin-like domain